MTAKDKKIIADSETAGIPIFVFTAKDKLSVNVLANYHIACHRNNCPESHTSEINDRIIEFEKWQKTNPDKVKLPD